MPAVIISPMVGFLSTPSARRATRPGQMPCLRPGFLSTPSARRATDGSGPPAPPADISIHALREEGDRCAAGGLITKTDFYPRPPRGGRQSTISYKPFSLSFLSTPSARRATRALEAQPGPAPISIHALREEGDVGRYEALCTAMDFYPRPPRGGRLNHRFPAMDAKKFLSTPSARRATSPAPLQTLPI